MPLTERFDLGVSLSWVVSVVVVFALVVEVLLPTTIVQALPFGPAIAGLVSDVGPLTLALVALIAIIAGWVISARFGEGGTSTASSTAERVEDTFETFAKEWLTITRVVVTGLVTLAFFALTQLGDLLGIAAGYVAEAPVVGANLVTIGLGWLALGGELPIVGPLVAGITPTQWALITLVALGLGVAVKNA